MKPDANGHHKYRKSILKRDKQLNILISSKMQLKNTQMKETKLNYPEENH